MESPPAMHDFAVDEAVVSLRHGVGTVTERKMRPSERGEREYLTIELERHGLRLMIPVEGGPSSCLRRVSSREEAEGALAALAGAPEPLPPDWRARQKMATERLGVGDLLSTAELVRDFAHRARAAQPKTSDRELFDSAIEVLGDELGAVLAIDSSEAAGQVRDCLDGSGGHRI